MQILARIASGLAGWLTYEDMRRRVKHHDEHTLYGPISEIAEAHEYIAVREFPLPKKQEGRGSPKEVDFLLVSKKHKEHVLLEVKFKKTAKAMAGNITRDARKIRDVSGDVINQSIAQRKLRIPKVAEEFTVKRAVLVVWREGDILKAIRQKETSVIQFQFMLLFKHMFNDWRGATVDDLLQGIIGKKAILPVNLKAGYLRWSSASTSKRYWVAVLTETARWDGIEG